MTPEISLLTTVFNGQRYIEATIRSALNQTFREFEYVIVDDGSTDDTPRILQKYAEKDDRLRIIRQANAGIPKAANAGLAACRAPWIARTDADDLLKPDRLKLQLDFMRESDAVCAGTFVDFMDEHARMLTTITCPTENDAIQEAILSGHCAIWHTSSMMRRDAVESINGYDEAFDCALDLDLWLRLGEVGPLANVPRSLQLYRLHRDSVSESKRVRQRERCRVACERAYARRGLTRQYSDPGHWRPGSDAGSQFDYALRYGWWAYQSGHRGTAMHYGTKAVCLKPMDSKGWKLIAIAALKTPRVVSSP